MIVKIPYSVVTFVSCTKHWCNICLCLVEGWRRERAGLTRAKQVGCTSGIYLFGLSFVQKWGRKCTFFIFWKKVDLPSLIKLSWFLSACLHRNQVILFIPSAGTKCFPCRFGFRRRRRWRPQTRPRCPRWPRLRPREAFASPEPKKTRFGNHIFFKSVIAMILFFFFFLMYLNTFHSQSIWLYLLVRNVSLAT
jgi:hypothetical protein